MMRTALALCALAATLLSVLELRADDVTIDIHADHVAREYLATAHGRVH